MPTAPLRPCPAPRCAALTTGGFCRIHARHGWTGAVGVRRIRGGKLQRLRQRLFEQQPLCVGCLETGRATIATIRDHIIPLAEGGLDDETNVQPLCQACSDAKSAQEIRRGLRRVWR